jgi:hypothetical protein
VQRWKNQNNKFKWRFVFTKGTWVKKLNDKVVKKILNKIMQTYDLIYLFFNTISIYIKILNFIFNIFNDQDEKSAKSSNLNENLKSKIKNISECNDEKFQLNKNGRTK